MKDIHFDLQPEPEAELAAQALPHGLRIERYLEGMVTERRDEEGLRRGLETSLKIEPFPLTRSSPNFANGMPYRISFAREAIVFSFV